MLHNLGTIQAVQVVEVEKDLASNERAKASDSEW